MGSFVPGHLVPTSWQTFQNPGNPIVELNVKETSLDISVMLHDVTGVKAIGIRARIGGPLDLAGRVVCDLDLDEAPWITGFGILPGFIGVLRFGVTANGARIELPMICEKLHFAGAVEKELMWDADFKCNSLAGTLVYPAL